MLYGVIYVTWFDYIGTWYSPLYVILMYSKIHNSKTRFAPVKYLKSAVPMGEESNFRIRQPRFQCQLYHWLAESLGYLRPLNPGFCPVKNWWSVGLVQECYFLSVWRTGFRHSLRVVPVVTNPFSVPSSENYCSFSRKLLYLSFIPEIVWPHLLSTEKMWLHTRLTFMFQKRNQCCSNWYFPVCNVSFSLAAFNMLSLSSVFRMVIRMCTGIGLFGHILF